MVLFTRLFRILRSHWGYWIHGRRERRERRVVVARPSSQVYVATEAQFESRLTPWIPTSCAPFVPPNEGYLLSVVSFTQEDPRLSRDRFNPGRNTA